MALRRIWTELEASTFVQQLEDVASNRRWLYAKRSYVCISASETVIVEAKSKASSLRTILQAIQEIKQTNSLVFDKIQPLQRSLAVIENHYQKRSPTWYYRIPIISWIYSFIKRSLLNSLDMHIKDLDKKMSTLAYKMWVAKQFFTNKSVYIDTEVRQDSQLTSFFKDKSVGSVIVTPQGIDCFKAWMKLPSWKNDHIICKIISIANNFERELDDFVANALPENQIRILKRTNRYIVRTFFESSDELLIAMNRHQISNNCEYCIVEQFTEFDSLARILGLESLSVRLFIQVIDNQYVRLINIGKRENIFKKVQQLLDETPAFMRKQYAFKDPVRPTKTPEEKMKEAKKSFLRVLDPSLKADTTSFSKTLELRKAWYKKNHTDKCSDSELKIREVSEAWDALVKCLQSQYKNASVDGALLREIDKKYPLRKGS